MRQLKLATVLLMTCCLAGGAFAQAGKPASMIATRGPVLKQIPAGSMGYLVINSMKGSMDAVDKFLLDIGVSQLIKADVPDGIMAMIQKELALGEGFDATGGFAAVMLDPAPFNVDIPALLQRKMTGEKIEDVKLPFVVFIPASDAMDETFPGLPMTQQGDMTVLDLPIGPVFAIQYNGYILISPNDKALLAVKAAKVMADSELSADRAALIARSNIAIQLNMKTCWPVFSKLLDIAEQQMANQADQDDMGPLVKAWQQMGIKVYKELFGQIDNLTISGRIGKTGLMFEELVDWNPASDMGKALAGVKVSDKPLLGRLPNLTYALAIGSAGQPVQDQALLKMQAGTDALLKSISDASGGKVTKDQLDRFNKLSQDLSNQCTGCQMVIGGAPAGNGLFGLACVTECADAAKARDTLAQLTALAQEIINSLVTDEKDRPTITYTKSGEEELDVIEISPPEMANMTDDSRKVLKTIMGEEKIRILVGSPSTSTLVVTFGGGTAFMADAARDAVSGGTLPKDAGIVQAMEYMPKNMVFVMALNTSNLVELIMKGTQEFGAPPLPFHLINQVPLTIGVGITASSEHVVIFVPTAMVKEVAGMILMQSMMSQPRQPRATSMPKSEEF